MSQKLDIELKISKFLRAGTVVAGLLIAAGWLWNFDIQSGFFSQFGTYQGMDLDSVLADALNNYRWGPLLSYGGLATLISLPVIRVLLIMILFIRQHEHRLAAIAALVLAALIFSMALGLEL